MDPSQLAALLQMFGKPAAGAAGAGAAGALGAAGLSAASALNPVSAGIMAAAPLASGIYGIVQKAQADKLRKQFDQPMYAIPEGMQEAYGLAQSRAFDTSLPGQSLIEAGIDRGQAAANRAIMETGMSGAERLAAINAGAGNRMDANTQLAMQMAQQQQQNLANYQNTLGQLAGYQEKQWQLNKQQPWMDAMEAANRLAEAGSQNIMTGLKDLSGIGVAMAKQRTPNAPTPIGVTPMETRTPSLMTQPSISRTPDQYTIEQALGTTNLPIEGTGQDLIGQALGYTIANRNASQGTTTPPVVSTEQNVATTPPAVNTAQNVVTTQPTTTATEAVTPVATTLPAQENILPTVEITDTAPASTPIRGNMASPFNMQPNYNVQDQYGFMLPTQQQVLQSGPPTLQSFIGNTPMAMPTQQSLNPYDYRVPIDLTSMFGPGYDPSISYRDDTPMTMEYKYGVDFSKGTTWPAGYASGPTMPVVQSNEPMTMPTTKGTKQMSAYPTMTQFQSASPREKLDLFAQGFGQFGLKGK